MDEVHPKEWNYSTISHNIQSIREWIADQYQELLKELGNYDKKHQKIIHKAIRDRAKEIYDESEALFEWDQTTEYIHRLILKYKDLMED